MQDGVEGVYLTKMTTTSITVCGFQLLLLLRIDMARGASLSFQGRTVRGHEMLL